MRLVAALAFVALGCGNKTAATTSCADAARLGVDGLLKRAHEQHNDKLDAIAPRLRALIANRCADDKWPAAAIDCYPTIASMEDMRACRGALSPLQVAKLERDEMDLFAGASGPPGFGVPAPAKSRTVELIEDEVRRLNDQLAAAQKKLAEATTDAEREAARASVLETQRVLRNANDMLAELRAAGGDPAKAVESANARSADLAKLREELEALDVEIKRAIIDNMKANTSAQRAGAKRRLEAAALKQAEFQAKLDALAAPGAVTAGKQAAAAVDKLAAELTAIDAEIDAAVSAVAGASNDDERATAKQRLEAAKLRRDELRANAASMRPPVLADP